MERKSNHELANELTIATMQKSAWCCRGDDADQERRAIAETWVMFFKTIDNTKVPEK